MIYSFRVIKFQLNYDWNKLCILLVPQIHMFLTGIYFFKFKHIFKHARKFGEPSFYFMLIRNILESALFAVFRLDTNCRYLKKGIVKNFRNFFFIFAPKAILCPRPSGIDCALVRNEIRTFKSFSELFFDFGPYIVPLGRKSKKAPKRT